MFKYACNCGLYENLKNSKVFNVKKAFSTLTKNTKPLKIFEGPSREYIEPTFNNNRLYWPNIQNRNLSCRKGDQERDGSVPKLMYFQDPRKYLRTKLNLLRLRLLWDKSFREREFITGARQAAVALTDVIRRQDPDELGNYTTPMGFRQISRDMCLSKGDPRMQLIQFQEEHIKKAMPARTVLVNRAGRKHCFIDMFFAGLRNSKDFNNIEDLALVASNLRKYYKMFNKNGANTAEYQKFIDGTDAGRRIIFAQIIIRFYREYTTSEELKNWSVSFYKILSFDVLTCS